MSPISPKRRKLDHDHGSDAILSSEALQTQQLVSMTSQQPQSENANLPQAKRIPGRKDGPDEDSGALLAGGLSKSNMFKLQVDEMLAEVRPKYKIQMSGVDDTLRMLKEVIENIPGRDALAVSEATKSLVQSHRIAVPFPDPKPPRDAAYKLAYARPSNMNIVGSYAHKTMAKSDNVMSVDMIVTMPASIFQEKDYLNYRYFYKRSYYLACMSAGVQDAFQDNFDFRFDRLNGNDLQPILVVKPKLVQNSGKHSKGDYEVHIIPTAPHSFFLELKLRPTKNSIRPKDISGPAATTLPPTPFYNSSIRSDCNFESYLQLIHSASKSSSGFTDCCILGRIWLTQRGFGSSISDGGFGNFEWSVVTSVLLKGGGRKGHSVLAPEYSSYQMFKAFIQFLSTSDLVGKPLMYQCDDFSVPKATSPMFYDGPRSHNILFKMSPWSYHRLQDEAKISLEMLNDSTFDQFESTFILRESLPLLRYDSIVQVTITEQIEKVPFTDHFSPTMKFSHRIYDVLREGFGDRVSTIDIKAPETAPWSLKARKPPQPHDQTLMVAAIFDPANIDRLVDHGPPAEEKTKAAKFQEFWGEKAELRRFKDGSILESVVWPPGDAYSIFEAIVSYLAKRHLENDVWKSLKFVGQNFERILPAPQTGEESFGMLAQAFNTFGKDVRGLEGLPLQLRQLSAVSAQLRSSSIAVPHFSPRQVLATPADVIIQFEGSGRWPDDIVAIQRTKIALLLKIRSLLQESNDGITTRLGLENEDHLLQNSSFLDIIYSSGTVFRLRIHSDREQTLLERQIKDKTSISRIREDAILALSLYKRHFIQLPLHTRSVSTHITRFPLLSPTIRLVKIWFDRHLLSPHFNEELIELIVVRAFMQPYPWRAPSSAMAGFLRTLQFISRWDWRLVPLIVDFSGTMTSSEVAAINTRLTAWRKIDPGMSRTVLVAASNHDMTGRGFTDTRPSKVVAARMTTLARSACKLVKDESINLNEQDLFATSTSNYDFAIHIASKFTTDGNKKKSDQRKFKNLEVQSDINLETVGYQPVQLFLKDVERLYASSVVLFYSTLGTTIIGGLWNPQSSAPRPFKVNIAYATKVTAGEQGADGGSVELDKPAILAEITRIGGDIIARIDVNR